MSSYYGSPRRLIQKGDWYSLSWCEKCHIPKREPEFILKCLLGEIAYWGDADALPDNGTVVYDDGSVRVTEHKAVYYLFAKGKDTALSLLDKHAMFDFAVKSEDCDDYIAAGYFKSKDEALSVFTQQLPKGSRFSLWDEDSCQCGYFYGEKE